MGLDGLGQKNLGLEPRVIRADVVAKGDDVRVRRVYWAAGRSNWLNFCAHEQIGLQSIKWRWSPLELVAGRGRTKTVVPAAHERRSETLDGASMV